MARSPRAEPPSPSAEEVLSEVSARRIVKDAAIPYALRLVYDLNGAARAYLNEKQTLRFATTAEEKKDLQIHTVGEQRRVLESLQRRSSKLKNVLNTIGRTEQDRLLLAHDTHKRKPIRDLLERLKVDLATLGAMHWVNGERAHIFSA